MKKIGMIAAALCSLLFGADAMASGLVYQGMNPEITPTADPLNETANAAFGDLTKKTAPTASSQLTEAELLKQSVISGLSTTYQQLLTGATSGSGTVNFGDGSYATYTTVGNTRFITFHNLDGTTTEISFPLS